MTVRSCHTVFDRSIVRATAHLCQAPLLLWALLAACSEDDAPGRLTAPATVDVVTRSYDNLRTGHAAAETILHPGNVGDLHRIASLDVDGDVFAQPLYLHGYPILGAPRNAVFVATTHNTVFAFDASTAAPLWTRNLGPSVPHSLFPPRCPDSSPPEFGITSTPVIDRAAGRLYAVAKSPEGDGFRHRLAVIEIATGEILDHVDIAGSYTITDVAGHTNTVTFDPKWQLNRPGLVLSGDHIVIAFGAHCDDGDFRGWVFAYDRRDIHRQTGVYATTATTSGKGGGVWMAGQAPAVDDRGNLYFMTGNAMPANDLQWGDPAISAQWDVLLEPEVAAGHDLGDSFVKLGPPPGPDERWTVADWFTPNRNHSVYMLKWDIDLGSGGAVLIPNSGSRPWILGGGKTARLYLLDSGNMGRYTPLTDLALQEVDVGTPLAPVPAEPPDDRRHIHGSPVWWDDGSGTLSVYLWNESSPVRGYHLRDAGGRPSLEATPFAASAFSSPDFTMPGGVLTISSNGGDPASGVIWGTSPIEPLPFQQAYTRVAALRAFDARTLEERWVGPAYHLAKFAPPTVAEGRVYVATFDHRVDVYGLGPSLPTSNAVFAGAFQLLDASCVVLPAGADPSTGGVNAAELAIESRTNPLTGDFHCPSQPYYVQDSAGNPVPRWTATWQVGRVTSPDGSQCGATQYACLGRVDPETTYLPEWGGFYQRDDCAVDDIANGLLSPPTLACPGGAPGLSYGRVTTPGGSCAAEQQLCRVPAGTGVRFGGMYQVSDCDHLLDVGNPVLDSGAACPSGMSGTMIGRVQEPEGKRCSASQFACYAPAAPVGRPVRR